MAARTSLPRWRDAEPTGSRSCWTCSWAGRARTKLGGPGETPETLAATIGEIQQLAPDAVGAALGLRIYPGTRLETLLGGDGPLETNRGLRRHYTGPIDLLQPTFYTSPALGARPAELVRELIGDDPRFFPPEDDCGGGPGTAARDHNYNANQALIDAIAGGARGAYWDILRQLREAAATARPQPATERTVDHQGGANR